MAISLDDVQRGYDAWAAKPHNEKWVRKIDGTPIANDIVVTVFDTLRDNGSVEAARIGDAILSWLVKYDLADAGNEYDAADVIEIMNDLSPSPEARATAAEATVTALQEKLENYEEILRCVCHHLELPQYESGPADDLRLYDRALEAADLYTRQADKDLAENKDLRFKAEAEAFRLREALKPFADEAYRTYPNWDSKRRRASLTPSKELTVEDFRRARKALTTIRRTPHE